MILHLDCLMMIGDGLKRNEMLSGNSNGCVHLVIVGGTYLSTIIVILACRCEVIVLSLTRANAEFIDHDVKKRMGIFRLPKPFWVSILKKHIYIANNEDVHPVPLSRQQIGNCSSFCDPATWRTNFASCMRLSKSASAI